MRRVASLEELERRRAFSPEDYSPLKNLILREEIDAILRYIKNIPRKDAEIISMRFGFGGPELTIREISEKTGISKTDIHRRLSIHMDKLGKIMGPPNG